MNPEKLKQIIEGALLAAGRPLSIDYILSLFIDEDQPGREDIRTAIQALQDDCEHRGVELKEVSTGFRYQVKIDLAQWVARLWEEKPARYSRAVLETLALIAYRQPITRSEIEDVRGVSVSSHIVKSLLEREWIRVIGHRDVPGKPALFGTTKTFLDYFNLKSLSDLPPLAELRNIDSIERELDFNDPQQNNGTDGQSANDASLDQASLPQVMLAAESESGVSEDDHPFEQPLAESVSSIEIEADVVSALAASYNADAADMDIDDEASLKKSETEVSV